jgi:hypothetical protein
VDSNSYKYQRKELELKALLEITQAINENQSEEVLINIFKFTCLVHLDIRALILYVAKEGDFEQRIAHGVKSKTPVPPVINAEHTSIMQDADIVISSPTSMVIECMILGKKVVLDLTNDGVNRSTTRLAYKNYIHFRILDKINNLDKCFSIDELRERIESHRIESKEERVHFFINNKAE